MPSYHVTNLKRTTAKRRPYFVPIGPELERGPCERPGSGIGASVLNQQRGSKDALCVRMGGKRSLWAGGEL